MNAQTTGIGASVFTSFLSARAFFGIVAAFVIASVLSASAQDAKPAQKEIFVSFGVDVDAVALKNSKENNEACRSRRPITTYDALLEDDYLLALSRQALAARCAHSAEVGRDRACKPEISRTRNATSDVIFLSVGSGR